jgi:hypothetical protein
MRRFRGRARRNQVVEKPNAIGLHTSAKSLRCADPGAPDARQEGAYR